MKLLFVAQRYGRDIAGGAEQLVRQFAERLADRDHEVAVLTSCAESYADWANAYRPGRDEVHGIPVHRLPSARPRDHERFGGLDQRVRRPSAAAPLSMIVAEAWSHLLGPELPDLGPWLRRHAADYDAVVFSGYLFRTSVEGLPATAPFAPTVLQPVAHDEPYLHLPTARRLVDHAAGICALSDEEADLIRRRFRPAGAVRVVGGGIGDVPEPNDALDRFGLRGREYLVTVGRLEPGKGVPELIGFMGEYHRRHGDTVPLVLVGANLAAIEDAPGVIRTGFVDDVTRWTLTSGATVLAQPSYFESFSLSLAEGWQTGRPALVQGRCDVLAGQVARSGGGLAYRSYAEFEEALGMLLARPELRSRLGEGGKRYVQRYRWPRVLDAFEACVDESVQRWRSGAGSRIGQGAR